MAFPRLEIHAVTEIKLTRNHFPAGTHPGQERPYSVLTFAIRDKLGQEASVVVFTADDDCWLSGWALDTQGAKKLPCGQVTS